MCVICSYTNHLLAVELDTCLIDPHSTAEVTQFFIEGQFVTRRLHLFNLSRVMEDLTN